MFTKEKVHILAQLIQALDDAVNEMEKNKLSYDVAQFEKYKKIALEFQLKINELLKA